MNKKLKNIKDKFFNEKLLKLCYGCFSFGVGACVCAFVALGIFVLFLEPRPNPCDCVNFEAIKTSMNLPENTSIASQSPIENTCEVTLEANQNRYTYYVGSNFVIEGQMILKPGEYSSRENEPMSKPKLDFKKQAKADSNSKNINFN